MFCKNCGTKNDNDMTFCQNCGESIKTESVVSSNTPTGNTIKNFAGIFFALEIIFGVIALWGGIIMAATMESAIPFLVGVVIGGVIIAFAFLSRALFMVTELLSAIVKGGIVNEVF
ncbi:MAG: zinc-ribbon domain-containing protein [Oscillospiraceae bacterium]|jgi:uncharacterized membrane protein YvbJ|nr:zinc-ribbon domain-containing protein [Oscillospiraceae bacterium]